MKSFFCSLILLPLGIFSSFCLSCSNTQEVTVLKSDFFEQNKACLNPKKIKSLKIEGDVNSDISFQYNDSLQLSSVELILHDNEKKIKKEAIIQINYHNDKTLNFLSISTICLGEKSEKILYLDYTNGQYSGRIDSQEIIFGGCNAFFFSQTPSGFIEGLRYINTIDTKSSYSRDYTYSVNNTLERVDLNNKGVLKALVSTFITKKEYYTNPIKFVSIISPILSDIFLEEFSYPFYGLFICLKSNRLLPAKQIFEVNNESPLSLNIDTVIVEVTEGVVIQSDSLPLKVRVTHTGEDFPSKQGLYAYTINYKY